MNQYALKSTLYLSSIKAAFSEGVLPKGPGMPLAWKEFKAKAF